MSSSDEFFFSEITLDACPIFVKHVEEAAYWADINRYATESIFGRKSTWEWCFGMKHVLIPTFLLLTYTVDQKRKLNSIDEYTSLTFTMPKTTDLHSIILGHLVNLLLSRLLSSFCAFYMSRSLSQERVKRFVQPTGAFKPRSTTTVIQL